MNLLFHPEALAEYESAVRYYAEHDRALAERFVQAVEDAIDMICDSPLRWRVLDDDIRRCLTHVFPYGILYTILDGSILITAIMHCSREPGYWKTRISRLGAET